MEVYLIRHTTPDVSKGICYGQTDLEIDKTNFAEDLKTIQSKLPNDIGLFYSSPLKRCVILAQKLSSNFKTDARLKELNFGKWENKNWNDLKQSELNSWMADFVNAHPPNGENYMKLYERTVKFMETLLQTSYKKVVIITHAGNIRSIISYVLDLPLENSFRINLNYGTVINIQLKDDKNLCKLISIN